jgi:hypothetical protein
MIKMALTFSLFAIPALSRTLYDTDEAALQACPTDMVVWLNTRSRIYHFQVERYNDNAERAAFVCEQDANNNGDRPTENGQ